MAKGRVDREPGRRPSNTGRARVCATIAFAIGYTVRVLALYRGWEEPLAKEPAGVYMHDDGRPLLGRKLKGKSKRELQELGLDVEAQPSTGGTDESS